MLNLKTTALTEFASTLPFRLHHTKTSDGAATISLYFEKEVPDELQAIFIE